MTQISEYISWGEATKSQTAIRYGIDNTPSDAVIEKMRLVANLVFDVVREHFNKPIGVASFYRSPKLNVAVGGAVNSQHLSGEAIDIDADIFSNGVTNKQIFDYIRSYVDFDQLIGESIKDNGDFEWIHVSYKSKVENRHNVLIGYMENKKMKYKKYIP
jgi:hypothetical protein